MSIILKGIDMPEPIKDQYTYLELYVRSDGVVFDDDFEEVAEAIQIPKDHGRITDITKYKKEGAMQDGTCQGCPNLNKCDNYTYTKWDVCVWLDYAPTILEAEE